MKPILTFIIVFTIIVNGNAQKGTQDWHSHRPMVHYNGNDDYHNKNFKDDEKCADTVEHSILKKLNSNYRVLDSTDYYTGADDQWIFESRGKVVSRDRYGNVLEAKTDFYHSDSDTWSNKYRMQYSYADPLNHVPDTYTRQVWDSENANWQIDTYVKYNSKDSYTELFSKTWDFIQNRFTGGYRYYYVINNQDLPAERLVQEWDATINDWINDVHYSYSYTNDGKPFETVRKNWNTATNQWVIYRKDIYEYDQSGNNIKQIIQYWSGSSWINRYLYQNIFDTDDRVISIITKTWNSSKSEWSEIQKNENSYNSDGKLIETIISRKDAITGLYIYFQRQGYIFDVKGNQLNYLTQIWNQTSLSWINVTQNIHEYDHKGNVTTVIQQNWDTAKSVWVDDFLEKYRYAHKELNVEYYKQIWKPGLNRWVNVTRRCNYFSGIKNNMGHSGNQVISCLDKDEKSFNKNEQLKYKIFPNPASERITVVFENAGEFDIKRIDLTDTYGKLIRSYNVKGNEIFEINRGNLRSGKYFIRFVGKEVFGTIVIFK